MRPACLRAMQKRLGSRSRRAFPGRSRVIPLGIDPARFAPGPARGIEHDVITVGFLGRLVPEKGVRVLLEAMALDARLHARIAGAGPLSLS